MMRMVLTFILLFMAGIASADVLLIEEVRQAGLMSVPENGQTMVEVETRYGAPSSKGDPVGNPPITQWTYDTWSVYFEYDKVLFTVLHKGAVINQPAKSG